MQKLYKKLAPTDFVARPVTILPMHAGRWGSLPRRGSIVGYVPLVGAVAVWPAPGGKSHSLALAVLVLEAVKSVRANAAWLVYHQVEPTFHSLLAKSLSSAEDSSFVLGGQPVSWQSFIYHLSKQAPGQKHNSIESRLRADNIAMHEPEADLCQLDQSLRWWLGCRFAGQLIDGQLISFNMADAAINHANNRSLEAASTSWLAGAAMDELIARYMKNAWVEDSLISQLEEAR